MPRYSYYQPPGPLDPTPLYQQGIAAAGAAEEARGAGLDIVNRYLAQMLNARQRREEAATEFDYRRQLYGMQAREERDFETIRQRNRLQQIRERAAAEREEEYESALRYSAAAQEARGVLGDPGAFATWDGRLAEVDPALRGLTEGLDDKAAKAKLEQFFSTSGPPDRATELADIYGKRTKHRYLSPERWAELQERFSGRYGEEGLDALDEILGQQPKSLEDVYDRYQKGDVLSSVRALSPPTSRQETIEGGVKERTPSALRESIESAQAGIEPSGAIDWADLQSAVKDTSAIFGELEPMAAAMLGSRPVDYTVSIDEQGQPRFQVKPLPGTGGGEITKRLQAFLDSPPGRIAFLGHLAALEGGAVMTGDEKRAIGRAVGVRGQPFSGVPPGQGTLEEQGVPSDLNVPPAATEPAPSTPPALQRQIDLIERARSFIGGGQ